MKNKFVKLLAASSAAAGIFMSVGWPFFELMVHCKAKKNLMKKKWFGLSHIKINHPRYKFEQEYEAGKEWCRNQDMQDCYLRSMDGLRLHACYLPAERGERFVILSHGYRGSSFGDFAYTARFLHEHHCNLLFIDQRCCGESEGEYITFGAKEQYDVQRWAYYIARRNEKKLPIYLYGESMGATAVLMASGHALPREVRGLIADCGFCSIREEFRNIAAHWFHMHWVELLLLRVDLFCRFLAGFCMKDADTTEAMKTNRKPVLFFHGEKDTYVHAINTFRNYSRCHAPKELVIVPEARHLCSAYEQPEFYRKKLLKFFQRYDHGSDACNQHGGSNRSEVSVLLPEGNSERVETSA